MKKNEELFYLIKSLSKNEKRNFKLESTNKKNIPNYILLFDAIDSQSTYDEPKIIAQFKDERFTIQFHVLKNYLKQSILKSLRSFHCKNSKEIELKNCLSNIEILFNKELYQHCELEIRRAKKIAFTYELFSDLIEIQSWERKLIQTRSPHNYSEFKRVLQEQDMTIQVVKNQNMYHELIVDISSDIMKNKYELVNNEELLHDLKNVSSFESGVLHYNAKYFRSIQNNNNELAKEILNQLSSFFDRHHPLILNNPGLYSTSMNNAISYFMFNKDYKEVLVLIEKVKLFYSKIRLNNENKTLLKQVLRTYNIELETYRSLDIIDEKRDEIEHIKEVVKSNQYKMPKDYLISFYFQLANLAFTQEKFSEALKWVNHILNGKFSTVRTDLQLHSRILNLMIHLEMQNLFVLRYYLDSTKRFFKKINGKDPFINGLLQFFSKIGRAPLLEYRTHFKELKLCFTEERREARSSQSGYINYSMWIDKHLS